MRLRNEIIHIGSDFSFREDLELKCDNTLKLINYLLKPDKVKLEYKFKGKIVGRVKNKSDKEEVFAQFFTRTQSIDSRMETELNQ